LFAFIEQNIASMLSLSQLCPIRGPHAAQLKVFCGLVWVFIVVKVSYILTSCPYFDNLEFDIFVASVLCATLWRTVRVTTAVRIRTLSGH